MRAFLKNDRGATMVEYGVLIAVIALVAIVGATAFGTSLSNLFSNAATTIQGIPATKTPAG